MEQMRQRPPEIGAGAIAIERNIEHSSVLPSLATVLVLRAQP